MDTASEIFEFEVDYAMSTAERISLGQYDWTADDKILKRFSVKGKGIVKFEAKFFVFDHMIDSLEVIREIENADL